MRVLPLLLLISILFPLIAVSQPGTLDPEFGINTHIATNIGSWDSDYARAVAIQSDGKIVLAGLAYDYPSLWIALVRYLENGTIDSSFSDDGKALRNLYSYAAATAVAIQPDGKIIVGGWAHNSDEYSDFMLARFNADGTNDNSFDSDGILTTNLNQTTFEDDGVTSISLQPDGKIVAVGYSGYYNSDFAIARYNPDGSLDNSFGNDGKMWIDFSGEYDTANDVVIQDDGKIIVAGLKNNSSTNQDIAMVRLMPDGTPDSSFGTNGKVATDLSTSKDEAFSVGLQSNGKIVVAGQYGPNNNSNLLVVRYTNDGIIDSSYGINGALIYDIPDGDEVIHELKIQPDNKVIVAGYARSQTSASATDFMAAKINTDGTLDFSFGQDGLAIYDFMGFSDRGYSLAIETDGKVIIAGSGLVGTGDDFAWIRLNSDGSLYTFPPDGKITLSFSEDEDDRLYEILVQPDDKVIAIGYNTSEFGYDHFALARFLPDGALDTSFGNDGRIIHAFSYIDLAFAGTLQPDGKIIVAGQGYYWDSLLLVRLQDNGFIDSTFGNNGHASIGFSGKHVIPRDVALQANGKIIVAIEHYTDFFSGIVLARFNADGSLDNSFSNDGMVEVEFSYTQCCDEVYSLAIQLDGKILAAGGGYLGVPYSNDFGLARLFPGGTFDNTFDSDGIVTTNFEDYYIDDAYAVALQPDGKILCAGSTQNNNPLHSQFGLTRYNPDGSLDNSFGNDGKVTTNLPGVEVVARAMVLLPNGKILIAGSYEPLSTADEDFIVVRYHADGGIDESFGSQGLAITDFSSSLDVAHSLALQGDGKILVGGYTLNNNNVDFALVRYLNDIAINVQDTIVKNATISIFPNPTNGIIHIQSDNAAESDSYINLYSYTGKELLQRGLKSGNGVNEQIDLSVYASGMYFITVSTNESISTQKVQLIK